MSTPLKNPLGSLSAEEFAQCVVNWQKTHGRNDLPWQRDANPYHVLVSEVMLQQTQVATVIPYFERWLEQFPSIEHLAQADTDQVLALWQGLGYYSRARNLQRAAQQICQEYQGRIPQAVDELQEIVGIGAYTAGAIRSFAYDMDGVIVDGNVKRLFSRLFAISGDLSSSAKQRELWQLAEYYTPNTNNRRYAQGLLDLGATICTARQPKCPQCPLQKHCQAWLEDRVAELPERKVKPTIPIRTGYFIWHADADRILLEQRPVNGIWPALWCLPQVAADTAENWLASTAIHGNFRHTFSHYKLQATVLQLSTDAVTKLEASTNSNWEFIPWSRIPHYGLPSPITKYLRRHLPKPTATP